MKLIDNLKQRRTYYNLNKNLPVSKAEVKKVIEEITELIPDAFNMKSARVLVVTDKKQDELSRLPSKYYESSDVLNF